MSDNVKSLREPNSIIGAYSADNSVVIDGHAIPKIRCIEQGDHIEFILDRRFGFIFPKEWAYLAASFAAQAMAIGAGYSNLGAKDKNHPFAPQVMMNLLEDKK